MSEHLVDLAFVLDAFLHPWVDIENIKRSNVVMKR